MSDDANPYDVVIRRSKEYEEILALEYGAQGQGLGQKVRDVAARLDPELVRRFDTVAAVRNRLVHEVGYSSRINLGAFREACAWIDAHLQRHPRPPVRPRGFAPIDRRR